MLIAPVFEKHVSKVAAMPLAGAMSSSAGDILDLRGNQMRTLHYVLKGDGGDPAGRQDCLEFLRVAWNN